MTIIEIDLNIRCGPNLTYTGLEDISGDWDRLETGQEVAVAVEGFGVVGVATINRIDVVAELVYLNIDWSSLDFSCGEG